MLPPIAWPFGVMRIRVWRHLPHLRHGESMDAPNLGDGDQTVVRPLIRGDGLLVYPPGGFGVSEDLHVILQLFRPHSAPLFEQGLDFAEDESVSLDRCRVVSFKMPQMIPQRLGFVGLRQPAVVRQLIDCDRETLVDHFTARSSASRPPTRRICHHRSALNQHRQLSMLSSLTTD